MKIREFGKTYTGVEQMTSAVITAAVSYCGANPKGTPEFVWTESVGQLHKFFGDLTIDEILEAFRLAANNQFPDVNLTAYAGQFSVKVLSDVLLAYIKDRNKVKVAVHGVLAQWVEDHLERVREEKDRKAREQFFQDFTALKSSGVVPDLDNIRFFWFATLAERGVFDPIPRERREELWKQAWQILRVGIQREIQTDRTMKVVSLRRQLDNLKDGEHPETERDKATGIYQKLLIVEALKL
jgi:hypothetical protein